jgi:broad specificity phosphatase PhoE
MIVSQFTIGDSIPNKGLLLLRHGPKKKRNHPLEQTNLSEDGIRQVLEFAEAWDGPIPSSVFTSPIDRCLQTASIIIQTNHWEQAVHESRFEGRKPPIGGFG